MAFFSFKTKPKAETDAPAVETETRPGLITRMRARLNRGDSWLTYDLANLLPGGRIDDGVLDELETRLISADVGIETTGKLLDRLRAAQAAHSTRPLRLAQVQMLSMCHHVNLDAICSGKAEAAQGKK